MKQKKSNTNMILVSVILSILTLLIVITIYFNISNDLKINNQAKTCSQFLTNINAFQKTYFGSNKNLPNLELKKTIENVCFKKNINDKNINQINNLIENCWIQAGSGINFLANYKGSICILCGQIQTKNPTKLKTKYLQNTNKLNPNLKKEIEGTNLNKYTLFQENFFPNSNKINIIYYIEQKQNPNSLTKTTQQINQKIKEQFYKFQILELFSNIPNTLQTTKNSNYVSAIILSEENNKTIKINNKQIKCNYLYIPNEK